MTVIIENEAEYRFPFDYEETIRAVVREALKEEGCPFDAEVSVVITDNAGIREINREYRGIDSETDVLSFPAAEYPAPADFSGMEDDPELFDPDTGEFLLGDIMISAERAEKQAEEYGHPLIRELAFLTAHSMLHLMGYDHINDEERIAMEERQERVLQNLGITRA
ncbi:MAG: rRNA maturation RNase YbeY [Lachnospiraceae bacterium]|nr:rRNA maturation RNase YbeY [Lachnospiraceae bacterium]MBQ7602309.1 rRNA maturation RNase YbeY [Lachnospiraceae bacterium]